MPKDTFKGTTRKRIKKSGFRIRMKTVSGQRVIKSRRKKGRKKVAL